MRPPFDEVVREHGDVVLRVCRALLGSADAEDAWSETFLAALRAYPELHPDSNVRGWLVTIAHHKAIDQIRRTNRQQLSYHDVPDKPIRDAPAQTLADSGDSDLIAALESLPPKQKGAVIYRYLADLSYSEVAILLDCSEPAARRNAADGIARLRLTYAPETDPRRPR
jgi:RNA polymerase sigma factor (sigma-70 family)